MRLRRNPVKVGLGEDFKAKSPETEELLRTQCKTSLFLKKRRSQIVAPKICLTHKLVSSVQKMSSPPGRNVLKECPLYSA